MKFKFDRKKIYYKILKRKNKQYLALVQRHKYLFENQLFKFVPNQSTPTNKKFNGIYLDKNKLLQLILSKGLNPAPQIMSCAFNASPDLKNFNDVLAFSQSVAMVAKPKFERSQSPYLGNARHRYYVRFLQIRKDPAKYKINKVLRAANLKEEEGLAEWTYSPKPLPRPLRKKGPQIYYGPHIGPKGIGYDTIQAYRTHGPARTFKTLEHRIKNTTHRKNRYLVKRDREKRIKEYRKNIGVVRGFNYLDLARRKAV